MSGPRWESGGDYLNYLKEKHPLIFELVGERGEDATMLLETLLRGAYIDGRIDGVEALARRIRKNRDENCD